MIELPPRAKNLTNQRFGRLVALYPERRKLLGWQCVCDCGQTNWVQVQKLTCGATRSCGCLARQAKSEAHFKHGHTLGKNPTRAYRAWSGMHTRCENKSTKNYNDYGGRGIKVCEDWRDFSAFLRDMGEPPPGTSLDRVDNDQGYSKGNCRWATRVEQANNKRSNRLFTAFGRTQGIVQWSQETGLDYHLLYNRLVSKAWPAEKALRTPVRAASKREARNLTALGRTQSLTAWSRELGVEYTTLHARIKYSGWSEHDALTIPAGVRRRA